jgi:RimJ/RimL family protein N-acetyltransferase
VTQEFAPVLASSTSKRGFLICVDGQEIGFAETYRVEDHREFFAALDVEAPGTAGCDLFIGETEWVGRGIGTRVIRQFTADLVLSDATVTQAIAAPDLRNEGSQRAFARAGYQRIFEAQVPGDAAPAVVMRADRDTIR